MSEVDKPLRNIAATLCSILLGVLVVVQAFINIKLSKSLGNPLRSAAVSMAVGSISLFIFHNLQQYQWIKCEYATTKEEGQNDDEEEKEQGTKHYAVDSGDNSENTAPTCDQSCSLSFQSLPSTDANENRQASSNIDIESPSIDIEKERKEVPETNGIVVGKSASGPICSVSRIPDYYHYVGGLLGSFFIANGIVSIPYIGYSAFFLCFVCGQLSSSLIVDKYGLLHAKQTDIRGGRYVGCGLTVVGAALLLISNRPTSSTIHPALTTLMVVGSFASGCCLTTQSCVNGILRKKMQFTVIRTALSSFSVATLALGTLAALTFLWEGAPSARDIGEIEWWYFLGGIMGLNYVCCAVVFPRWIGFSTFAVAIIAGQLVTSLLSDLYGLLGPVKANANSPLSILGVILGVFGTLFVSACK